VALSHDGKTFKKSSLNPILSMGGWADRGVGEPFVVSLHDNLFRLYFTGYSSAYNRAIGQVVIDMEEIISADSLEDS